MGGAVFGERLDGDYIEYDGTDRSGSAFLTGVRAEEQKGGGNLEDMINIEFE